MKVAILLGFSYNSARNSYPLPGIIMDLYEAWLISKKILPHRLAIISDMELEDVSKLSDGYDKDVATAIKSKFLSEDFIEPSRKEGHWYAYHDRISLLSKIGEIVAHATEVFFYYSGHAKEGELLLPLPNPDVTPVNFSADNIEEENLHFSCVLDLFLQKTKKTAQIFIVLDCCGGIDPKLPYVLKGNIYRLISPHVTFFPQEIVCISSSSRGEQSAATRQGSAFSLELFEHIGRHSVDRHIASAYCERSEASKQGRQEMRLFRQILDTINKKYSWSYGQTACVYSSYPDAKFIWSWMISGRESIIMVDSGAEVIYVCRPG